LFGVGESMINPGLMQLADKGTIVFDEITNLPLNIQLDLLKFITRGEIELENGIVIRNIDVRIIATTCRDIKEAIKSGYFIEELYYRLNINAFHLKPLIERDQKDFEGFVLKFLDTYSKIFSKPSMFIEEDALEIIREEVWRDNQQGLEKFLEQLVYNSTESVITERIVVLELERLHHVFSRQIRTYDEYEEEMIKFALNQYKGVKNRIDIVADKLAIGRATLYRKIHKYNLEQ